MPVFIGLQAVFIAVLAALQPLHSRYTAVFVRFGAWANPANASHHWRGHDFARLNQPVNVRQQLLAGGGGQLVRVGFAHVDMRH